MAHIRRKSSLGFDDLAFVKQFSDRNFDVSPAAPQQQVVLPYHKRGIRREQGSLNRPQPITLENENSASKSASDDTAQTSSKDIAPLETPKETTTLTDAIIQTDLATSELPKSARASSTDGNATGTFKENGTYGPQKQPNRTGNSAFQFSRKYRNRSNQSEEIEIFQDVQGKQDFISADFPATKKNQYVRNTNSDLSGSQLNQPEKVYSTRSTASGEHTDSARHDLSDVQSIFKSSKIFSPSHRISGGITNMLNPFGQNSAVFYSKMTPVQCLTETNLLMRKLGHIVLSVNSKKLTLTVRVGPREEPNMAVTRVHNFTVGFTFKSVEENFIVPSTVYTAAETVNGKKHVIAEEVDMQADTSIELKNKDKYSNPQRWDFSDFCGEFVHAFREISRNAVLGRHGELTPQQQKELHFVARR